MFSTHGRARAATAYRRIDVETIRHTLDPYQQVSLLYAGVLDSIATARGAMARGDVPGKGEAIARALRILEEGLSASLDRVAGGELAQNLAALYDYCTHRLILANARNDDAALLQVAHLIGSVARGWAGIRKTDAEPESEPILLGG